MALASSTEGSGTDGGIMRSGLLGGILLPLLAISALVASAARADPKEDEIRAAELNVKAMSESKEGRNEEAARLFREAYQLHRNPNLLFNAARAYDKADNFEEAKFFYEWYLREETDPDGRMKGQERLDALVARVPGVLVLSPLQPGVAVTANGQPVSGRVQLLAGYYEISVSRDGESLEKRWVKIEAGKETPFETPWRAGMRAPATPTVSPTSEEHRPDAIPLNDTRPPEHYRSHATSVSPLVEAPTRDPKAQWKAGTAFTVVGTLGLAAAVITHVLSYRSASDAVSRRDRGQYDQARTGYKAAYGLYGASAVCEIIGIALLATRPKSGSQAGAAGRPVAWIPLPIATPTTAGMRWNVDF